MTLTIQVCDLVEESNRSLLSKHPSWERVKISDIATLLNGYAFKSSNFDKSKGFPLIRIRDIKTNITECCYNGDYDPAYVVKRGDLLIGMDGDFNVARWRGNDALLNQRVCKIQLSTNLFDGKLLEYLLPPYLDAIHEKTSSQTVKHLSSKSILEIPLPLPPLSEQHRIVAKIEELFTQLDAGVAALTTALAQLKRYRQSVLKAAFEGKLTEEWRKKNRDNLESPKLLLERINRHSQEIKNSKTTGNTTDWPNLPKLPDEWLWCNPVQISEKEDPYALAIGPFGSNLKVSDYTSEGVPIIFVRNITGCTFSSVTLKHVSESKAAELRPHWVMPGDILITKMGDPPGDVCLYPQGQPKGIITSDCLKVRIAKELGNPQFFVYTIRSNVVQSQIYQITKGVAQKKISLARFKTICLPLPSLEEQHQILAEIERRFTIIDETEKTIQQSLTQAERLRQSILKRAFEGKLVPQDPHDEPASLLLERITKEKATLKTAAKGQKKTKRSEKSKTTQQELI